ncbi:MAG: hypothetical protein JF609_03805 [Verrucomicrobia bacterium]|nr:hypothetical protein [Verrucomicrobiota bacterium]
MNNNENQFEERVSRQPLRAVPAEWRAEILAAARAAQPASQMARVERHSFLSTINRQLVAILWPHPKAWAGLAAVWMCIIGLNLSTREKSPVLAEKSVPASPEVVVELRKQQKLYAELMGMTEPREAERPKDVPGRPRTQRVEVLVG